MNRKTEEFFALKHAIDDQVARLGWSKERCIVYIKDRYGVRSRLSMTDEQLKHLLKTLSKMSTSIVSTKPSTKVDRRRRRRRI
ncbi:MAG: hypothetical protein KME09_16615 [Pleurocapsa minor HA4230-MV1]|jgi:hypothetical protein|nr:hypothetical protein [Pleurocapsa minor HA4230-MV1]